VRVSGSVLVEICVDDLEGAPVADVCGADRIELCADLAQGGTTPSIGLIRAVAASVEQADVQVIGRPRGGNFVFTDAEIELMADDIAAIVHVAAQARTSVGISLGSSGWPPKPTSPVTVGPRRRGLGHGSGGDCHPPDSARKGRPVRQGVRPRRAARPSPRRRQPGRR
jgi:hypothetical protein